MAIYAKIYATIRFYELFHRYKHKQQKANLRKVSGYQTYKRLNVTDVLLRL